MAFDVNVITNLVVAELPQEIRTLPENRLDLVVNDIKNLVDGNIVSEKANPSHSSGSGPLSTPTQNQPCRPCGGYVILGHHLPFGYSEKKYRQASGLAIMLKI